MTKLAALLLFTILISHSWSQTAETDSVRWIRIQKTETNAKLFEFNGMNDSTLFGSIWRSAYYGENVFFFETKDISDKAPKYFELLKFPVTDSLKIDSTITFPWEVYEWQLSNAIVFAYRDNPLMDVFGDPVILYGDDGTLCFIYPPFTYTVIPTSEIEEIRIKEKRIFNELSGKYEYVPIAVQLTPERVSRMDYTIWLDLDKMRELTPNTVNQDWYTFIHNRSYKGEQYMQLKHPLKPN